MVEAYVLMTDRAKIPITAIHPAATARVAVVILAKRPQQPISHQVNMAVLRRKVPSLAPIRTGLRPHKPRTRNRNRPQVSTVHQALHTTPLHQARIRIKEAAILPVTTAVLRKSI